MSENEATTARAKAVLAQQKTLTQVGEALRTINRQSSDLLEIAHKGILLIRSYIPQQENRFDGKACSIDR